MASMVTTSSDGKALHFRKPWMADVSDLTVLVSKPRLWPMPTSAAWRRSSRKTMKDVSCSIVLARLSGVLINLIGITSLPGEGGGQ